MIKEFGGMGALKLSQLKLRIKQRIQKNQKLKADGMGFSLKSFMGNVKKLAKNPKAQKLAAVGASLAPKTTKPKSSLFDKLTKYSAQAKALRAQAQEAGLSGPMSIAARIRKLKLKKK
jgi:hypothetical protein